MSVSSSVFSKILIATRRLKSRFSSANHTALCAPRPISLIGRYALGNVGGWDMLIERVTHLSEALVARINHPTIPENDCPTQAPLSWVEATRYDARVINSSALPTLFLWMESSHDADFLFFSDD